MQKNKIKKQRSVLSQIFRGVMFFLVPVVFLLVMIVLIIPGCLSFFAGKDIAPVDDSSLQLQVINIPEAENAFYDLDKIQGTINLDKLPKANELVLNYLKSDQWDQAIIDGLLADNEQVLQYFSDAAAKGKFQSPYTDNPAEVSIYSPVVSMNPWREISRLSGVKAINLARNGQSEEAFSEAFKIIIVGDAIESSQCNLITYLVGIAMKNTGLDVLQKVVSMLPEDYSQLSKYQAELEKYRSEGNSTLFSLAYLAHEKVWSEIAQSSDKYVDKRLGFVLKNKFYYKPNLTVSYIFDIYSRLAAESRKECSEIKDVSMEPDELSMNPNFVKTYFAENAAGRILLQRSGVALNNVLKKRCELETKLDETLLLMSGGEDRK